MNAETRIPGIHHVTAIAGDPTTNAAFYTDVLGLRLVKKTVNHDDKYTYHLYFGDGEGTPGTNITFFPWGDRGRPGRFGSGQTQTTAFIVPASSIEYWHDRLDEKDIAVEGPTTRFGEPVLTFEDPDGITLELIGVENAPDGHPWDRSSVPNEHAIRGFHSVTLALREHGPTAAVLETMGLERSAESGERVRYQSASDGIGSFVDLVVTDSGRGQMGVGTVHHVAFKAEDQDEQRMWQEVLQERLLRVTEIIDRKYFHSIYYREPGGVLFEIATMGPGFTVDEDIDELGTHLTLPVWLEDERAEIEDRLPPFNSPVESADATTSEM